uniref:Uncharacterized protein n=1 Tax=Anopheles atroparvus TaxID=41427 RepID=A0A182ISQ3_ANOAO
MIEPTLYCHAAVNTLAQSRTVAESRRRLPGLLLLLLLLLLLVDDTLYLVANAGIQQARRAAYWSNKCSRMRHGLGRDLFRAVPVDFPSPVPPSPIYCPIGRVPSAFVRQSASSLLSAVEECTSLRF